jgi:hypothetical protein
MDNNSSSFNSNKDFKYMDPIIKDKKIWNMNYLFLAFIAGFIAIALQISLMVLFNLDALGSWILAFFLIVVYAGLLFFLLEPKLLREIKQPILQTIERPIEVIKEIDRPVIKEVLVEKPVEIVREITKPIYIEKPRKKLNIPKYAFVGSNLTKIFHKSSCRLGKSIKRKYKLHGNSIAFFKKRKYRGCSICITKQKKS